MKNNWMDRFRRRPKGSGEAKASTPIDEEMREPVIDIFLAQADSLKRLRRKDDADRKLDIAMTVASEWMDASPASANAKLSAAQVSLAREEFDLADQFLDAASGLPADSRTAQNIHYVRSLVTRERDIAAGSEVEMILQLMIYMCVRCGQPIEFISVPCWECGWRPTTLDEVKIATNFNSHIWSTNNLLGIGFQIKKGRRLPNIVPNLLETIRRRESESWFRTVVQSNYDTCAMKRDDYFSASDALACPHCGRDWHLPWAKSCEKCGTALKLAPPLRLLLALARLIVHFQGNLLVPDRAEDTNGSLIVAPLDNFARFVVSLHSKLYRNQDTPSDRERQQVIRFLEQIGEIQMKGGDGVLITSDPANIRYRLNPERTPALLEQNKGAMNDLAMTVRVVVDWMTRRKALL